MRLNVLPLWILVCLLGCGDDDDGEPLPESTCVADYGFELGGTCNDTGDSREDCEPGATCSCPDGTSTSYICFEGTCVTSIVNCDAWCAASFDEQIACF